MAFLDHESEHAFTALKILMHLGSSSDPDAHHMDLLARLQGVRRSSDLFCTDERASKWLAGMPVMHTTVQTMQLKARSMLVSLASFCWECWLVCAACFNAVTIHLID